MTHHNTPTLNRRQTLLTLLGAALLPGCGGGDATDIAGLSSGGTGSFTPGGTGSFTSGVVVGLGSVIVAGIRYDDSQASVTLDGVSSNPSVIQLGMVVRIQGSAVTPAAVAGDLATATATRIASAAEWKGQIADVDVATGRFTLLGQTVRVLSTTVFSGGPLDPGLQGQYAEVYGFVDPATGTLQASRVEVRTDRPGRYRLSGIVADLDTTHFRLGSATIRYAAPADPATLANGLLVQVELQTTPDGSGAWLAEGVQGNTLGSGLDDDDEAEIEGLVTAITSSTRFSVNGIAVDASHASLPPGLAVGARVEVKGAISNGVVIATEIEVKDDAELEEREYEFHGAISALDTVARTFVVRGYTVGYTERPTPDPTEFELHGQTWANDLEVEVKVRLQASGQWLATQIEADD